MADLLTVDSPSPDLGAPAERAETVDRAARRRRLRNDILIALGLAAVVLLAVIFLDPMIAGGVLLIAAAAYVFRGIVFRWSSMLLVLAGVVMFVPIRRYALPIDVGFALEPYRVLISVLLVAIVIGCGAGSSSGSRSSGAGRSRSSCGPCSRR